MTTVSFAQVMSNADQRCLHCNGPVDSSTQGSFCCEGCHAVYDLMRTEKLDRYYALRGDAGQPVPDAVIASAHRDRAWIETLEAQLAQAPDGVPQRIELDVQGLHCAACVWLLQTLFQRTRKNTQGSVVVNPTMGRMQLMVTKGFALAEYVTWVERFGYRCGPARRRLEQARSDLPLRMGICIALAMNAMLFAIAGYAGLQTGSLAELFHKLTLGLATGSVLVGGPVFFRSAWQAVRARALHLDVPIALGIILAYTGSVWSFLQTGSRASYLDTLTVFIALMLVGRWLQQRVVAKNQLSLLSNDGTASLLTRVLRNGVVTTAPCRTVQPGETLVIGPGDLVPVESEVLLSDTEFSLDWINGESAPHRFPVGSKVPAGAFLAGQQSVQVKACTEFSDSPLVLLLQTPTHAKRDQERARNTAFWDIVARWYVVAVLVAASAAFILWTWGFGDMRRALDVVSAILVVTCPCAFGLAAPMASELVLAGLRRAGLFVRTHGFLDRATRVKRVVFDKTGTLTTGVLRVSNPHVIDSLDDDSQAALFNMVSRSSHPRSDAISRAFRTRTARPTFETAFANSEIAGVGLKASWKSHTYSLLRSANDPDAVDFARDDVVLATIATEETLRPDARNEIAKLRRAGYSVWILSGDAQDRVDRIASEVGVKPEQAVGGLSPEGKAQWIRANDKQDTLLIGDGINDGIAASEAWCSGTPAIDRPFMPARTDFYFVTPGLRPIRLALRTARALQRVQQMNLSVATLYNFGTVGLSMAGLMTPLLCAVAMPATSVSILLGTIAALSARNSLWKSSFSKSS